MPFWGLSPFLRGSLVGLPDRLWPGPWFQGLSPFRKMAGVAYPTGCGEAQFWGSVPFSKDGWGRLPDRLWRGPVLGVCPLFKKIAGVAYPTGCGRGPGSGSVPFSKRSLGLLARQAVADARFWGSVPFSGKSLRLPPSAEGGALGQESKRNKWRGASWDSVVVSGATADSSADFGAELV